MTSYLFDPAPVPALPVQGGDALFPVRRIYCVGRNFADHAIEMGHDPSREPPFFFAKNPDSIVLDGRFPYPPRSSDVHFEIELVACLGRGGADLSEEEAREAVFGYAVGLDMTRRDLQGEAKKAGRPWEIGKAFERSAPISAIVPAARIGHPSRGAITLAVNGETRQSGDLAQMIWKTAEAISYLSGFFTLAPGDLVMLGTPAGVGAVRRGDRLEGRVEGVGTLDVEVV